MTPSLPEELLEQIFSNLRSEADSSNDPQSVQIILGTLLNISHTNRVFRRIARPCFWRKIDFLGRPWRYLTNVLNLFIKDPTAAAMVKEIHVGPWHTAVYPPFRTESTGTDYTVIGVQIKDYIEHQNTEQVYAQLAFVANLSLPFTFREALRFDLWSSQKDAQFALLLFLCVKVKVLKMKCPDVINGSLTFRILDYLSGSSAAYFGRTVGDGTVRYQPLQELQEFTAECIGEHPRLDSMTAILSLPTLTVFDGNRIRCQEDAVFRGRQFTGIRKLTASGRIGDGGFVKLLSATPSLESLFINFEEGGYITHREIGNALRACRGPLREVELDLQASEYLRSGDSAELEPVGSLRTLKSLQSLSIAESALLGGILGIGEEDLDPEDAPFDPLIEVLPFSLRKLELTCCTKHHEIELNDRVKDLMLDGRFTLLHTIILERDVYAEYEVISRDALRGLGWMVDPLKGKGSNGVTICRMS